jgi:protein phosphatase
MGSFAVGINLLMYLEMGKKFQISACYLSDKGMVRHNNEDYCLVDTGLKLFIVCDGVSGEPAGDVASKVAAEAFRKHIKGNVQFLKTISSLKVEELLADAASFAAKSVYDMAHENSSYLGMSTTLDALWIVGDRAFIAHIGDGAIYQLESNRLIGLTIEHNFKAFLMQSRGCTEDEALKSPYAHTLERVLGKQPFSRIDIASYELESGDFFLLCTDGLRSGLTVSDIEQQIVKGKNKFDTLARTLIELHNKTGGNDNATVIAVQVGEAQGASTEKDTSAPSRSQKEDKMRQVDFFKSLDKQDISKLLSLSKLLTVHSGSDLMKEGEVPDRFWVLLNGEVDFFRKGKSKPYNSSGPGVCLGEGAIFGKERRNSTVRASTDLQVLEFNKSDLDILFMKDRDFAARVFASIGSILMDKLSGLVSKLS